MVELVCLHTMRKKPFLRYLPVVFPYAGYHCCCYETEQEQENRRDEVLKDLVIEQK